MSPDSPRPNAPAIASLSVQEAAAAIVALINSRVHSPRQDELEAIVRRVGQAPQTRAAPSRIPQILALFAEADALEAEGTEAATDASDALADKKLGPLCQAIWAEQPKTLLDLQERAVIARYWLLGGARRCVDGQTARYWESGETWDRPEDLDDWGHQCIAHLIDAVLKFDGKSPVPGSDLVAFPITGSDGQPLRFDNTNESFCETFLPSVRMAFHFIGLEDADADQVVTAMRSDDFREIVAAWQSVAAKFGAIAEFARAASERVLAIRETQP